MEELIVKYVPDYIAELNGFLTDLAQYFAGGILICFTFWVIGFTICAVYGWLHQVSN